MRRTLVVFSLSIEDNTHIKLMRNRRSVFYVKTMLLVVLFLGVGTGTALATTSSSTNYQVMETQFNAGTMMNSCSGQYCAQASIGDMTTGNASSPGESTAMFGTTPTDSEPLLEVIVDAGESKLGLLSTEQTATKTTTVRVRSYLSDGYTLQIVGDPPKYGEHTLKTPTVPTESRPGTEQFAINAVANTSPSVGAAPVQLPSDQTSFGIVEDDYLTPNLFKYVDGDVVASSRTESGRTDFTISMIVNISNTTPAGHFTGEFSAVVIPIF